MHTKGPWRKVKRGAELFVEQHVPHNPRYIARVKHYSKDGEDNASLIAAAPRMLNVLESCLSLVQTMALERPDAKWLNENGWMSSTALCEDVILTIRKAKEN